VLRVSHQIEDGMPMCL